MREAAPAGAHRREQSGQLQQPERTADTRGSAAIDNAYWTRQFDRLRPIRLCPITPGEAPPYPSCAQKKP